MPDSLFSSNSVSVPVGIPLSSLTAAITNAVVSSPRLNGVWVIAELSDVRMSGGHCYMELIEKNNAGQTVAKLRANIWRSYYDRLRQKFFKATNKEIATGIKALVKGSATHHSVFGLSFNIVDIDPSYTIGDLERLRREIVLRLQREGIAGNNKALSLPSAPQKIAVISAEGAAGYGDFMNQLTNNSDGFVFYTCLFPAVMQGDKVSESIRKALLIIESTAELWDCVVIVRGGGATTDMNGFDDYELAKAVATCGLPVIVGIGHERDRNVLDEIANTSVKTPTAVAGFLIDQMRKAYDELLGCADRLRLFSTEMIRGEERRLSTIHGLIPQLLLRKLDDAKSRLLALSGKLPILTESRLGKEKIRLENYKPVILNLSVSKIGRETLRVNNLKDLLPGLANNIISKTGHQIEKIESLVKVLDPANTLKRGYSITRINGKALKSVNDVKEEDVITTTLSDGIVTSRIQK